jgi:AcrR family transcriptional regulator
MLLGVWVGEAVKLNCFSAKGDTRTPPSPVGKVNTQLPRLTLRASVNRAYIYRFYPSKTQEAKLNTTLELCRRLHNAALEERIRAHRSGVSLGYTAQANELPTLKQAHPEYAEIHSQVLQDLLRRLDKSFKAFFERVKQKKMEGWLPEVQARAEVQVAHVPAERVRTLVERPHMGEQNR